MNAERNIDLTTVGQEVHRMARMAVERAVARLEGDAADDDWESVVPPRLVIRSTTAAPYGSS